MTATIKRPYSKTQQTRLDQAMGSMSRLRSTFRTGDNRYGEYGRNCREAFERHAKVYAEITGKNPPSIYD